MSDKPIYLLTKTFGQWSQGTMFYQAGPIVNDEMDCESVRPIDQGKRYIRLFIPVRFLVEKRHRVKDWSDQEGDVTDEAETGDQVPG